MMIKKLRIKFIILSISSLLLLLGIIVISSNFWSYRELVSKADMVLNMIADNNGRFMHMLPPEKINSQQEIENKDIKEDIEPPFDDKYQKNNKGASILFPSNMPKDGMLGNRHMSPEILYESRFFTVDISSNGELSNINTENIAMVDEKKAIEYAQIMQKKKSDRGFIGEFRYLKMSLNNNIRVIFLDCGRNLAAFRGMFFINCMISFAGLIVISVFIVRYSKKLVLPVSESYEKQKQFISAAGHE